MFGAVVILFWLLQMLMLITAMALRLLMQVNSQERKISIWELSFLISGNTHYGWIRLDVNSTVDTVIIKDYAYEATPDAAIDAGEMGFSCRHKGECY